LHSQKISDSQAIVDAIRKIVHALELGSRAAQKTVGLSGAQLFVLQTLAAKSAMSVNELASLSYTHQSSVSVVVSRLVEAGFVKRVRSTEDGRRVELTVTAAGRRLLKADIVTPQERLFQALDQLPGLKLSTLRALLSELVIASGMDAETTPPMFLEKAQNRVGLSKRAPSKAKGASPQT
jgi:DNA-binding MarR family transcriptional regulator